MPVEYSILTHNWSFSCLWGCYMDGYTSRESAELAEFEHECFPSVA